MENDNPVKVPIVGRGIAVVLVLFIIPANYIFHEALLTPSNHFIISLQRLRTDSLDEFFKLVIYIGNNLTLVVVPSIIYNLYDTRRAVKQIFVNCFGMYFYSLIALFTKEPRPYWIDSNIKGINCEDGFASPFLELFLATVLYSSYSIEIFHKRKIKYKAIAYTVTAVFVILIAFGGLYLGQNYPHQIFITYCYTYVYVTIIFTLDREILQIVVLSCFNYKKNRKFKVHWLIATLFLLTGVVAVFDIVTLDKAINIEWVKNAYKDCHFHSDIGGGPNLQKSGWIFYNLGIVYGCMLSSKTLSMYWWDTAYWKKIIRVIISSVVSLGLFFFFSNFYLELIPSSDNTTTYIFHNAIPYFLMAYLISGLLPIVFAKISLAQPLGPEVDQESILQTYDYRTGQVN